MGVCASSESPWLACVCERESVPVSVVCVPAPPPAPFPFSPGSCELALRSPFPLQRLPGASQQPAALFDSVHP